MNTTKNFRIKNMSAQLLVADIERSIAFYTEKLGFDIDFRYEDFYVGIIKDGCSIHLKCVEERKDRRSNEDLDILFSVDGIEGVYEELLSKPVEIIQPLRVMPYGKEFYVADPDGNIIAFVE
ncbi:MAG: VOC family protein [Cyclobacteriaceae bacterium]|nr:VOC family protein [Cyclobacteriaceae bacterium]